jgi:hypothetical protein
MNGSAAARARAALRASAAIPYRRKVSSEEATMFEFRPGGLDEASEQYRTVKMEPRQEALIKDLAALVAPKLGIDPFPCSGFWLMAVRAWQIEHHTTADRITAMEPRERLTAALDITKHFREIIGAQLQDPEQRQRLEAVLDEAFELYLQKYNRR